jgi:hypothetical protein
MSKRPAAEPQAQPAIERLHDRVAADEPGAVELVRTGGAKTPSM